MAEWFMLLVFGISAGSAVAAMYARHDEVDAEEARQLEKLLEAL